MWKDNGQPPTLKTQMRKIMGVSLTYEELSLLENLENAVEYVEKEQKEKELIDAIQNFKSSDLRLSVNQFPDVFRYCYCALEPLNDPGSVSLERVIRGRIRADMKIIAAWVEERRKEV